MENVELPPAGLTARVQALLEKYGKAAPGAWHVARAISDDAAARGMTLAPGYSLLSDELPENFAPLLPWRAERRFVELKRIVDDRTIDPVLMCRFSCMTDGRTLGLPAALYRELDLAEWLLDATVMSVAASVTDDRWANVIVRLSNAAVCSLELATSLPAGTPAVDRHELIARRGVACDRLVDSQVPQSSVYLLTASGTRQFTDTDAELFGLPPDDVPLVRAAYEALAQAGRREAWRQQHRRLVRLVELVLQSARSRRRLVAQEVC